MEKLKEKIRFLKEEGKSMQKEIQRQTVGYIVTALGLIAGLAWNDAIKGAIEYLFPLTKNTLLAKFLYAFFITAAVVFLSAYVLRFFAKEKDKNC